MSERRFGAGTVRRAAVALAVSAAMLVGTGGANAVTCASVDLGTGREAGRVLPPGSPDPDWLLVETPILGAPAPAFVVEPFFNWNASASEARWVSVLLGSDPGSQPDELGLRPVGVYRYEHRFVIPPGARVSSTLLSFLADNGVTFELNGISLGGFDPSPGSPDEFAAFQQWHFVVIDPALFRPGVNTLTARVDNHAGWTGLLVDAYASACV